MSSNGDAVAVGVLGFGRREAAAPERTLAEEATGAMARYCDGDASAFPVLYALTAPRLLAYLTCLVRDRAAAEDLLQQTFIKVHWARGSYVAGADPVPWLYTIAHRTCLDELRRARRARVGLTREGAGGREATVAIDGVADDARPPYDERLVEAVLEALERLPENHRLAVVLTKIQGNSLVEAAAILGTTPGAVKLRAHRGYVMLREMLGAAEEGA